MGDGPEGDGWRVREDVRAMVRTERFNLLTDGYSTRGQFDLILCRNVLIYLSVENKTEVIKNINSALTSQGQLVLGAGETMLALQTQLPSRNVQTTLVFSKAGGQRAA